MGSDHRLEHRPADVTPAPPVPVEDLARPDQVDAPVPIPGLAVAEQARRSGAAAGDPLGGATVDSATEQALRSPSGGTRLDDPVRSSMEAAFDTDFGDVRVHTGPHAAQMSQAMQATAFTHGSDIYFSQGSFDPASDRGRHLLAHELTHVVQRKQGRDTGGPSPSGAPTIGRADDPLEAEAESVADGVVTALRRTAESTHNTSGCDSAHDH
jgi:hypothetical protein